MKTLLILVILVSTGCMSAFRGTINEHCKAHAEKYASYDQCYAEEADYRQNVRHSMSHMGDGLQSKRNDKNNL